MSFIWCDQVMDKILFHLPHIDKPITYSFSLHLIWWKQLSVSYMDKSVSLVLKSFWHWFMKYSTIEPRLCSIVLQHFGSSLHYETFKVGLGIFLPRIIGLRGICCCSTQDHPLGWCQLLSNRLLEFYLDYNDGTLADEVCFDLIWNFFLNPWHYEDHQQQLPAKSSKIFENYVISCISVMQ